MSIVEKKAVPLEGVFKDGSVYFFKSIPMILLFYIPSVAVFIAVIASNAIANPLKLAGIPGLPYMLIAYALLSYLYGVFATCFFIQRTAAMSGFAGNKAVNIWARALMLLPGYVLLQIFISVPVSFGLILCFLPGLLLGMMFSFVDFSYVLRGKIIFALKESWDIAKANMVNVLVVYLSLVGLYVLISTATWIPRLFVTGIGAYALDAVFTPLYFIFQFWLFAIYRQAVMDNGTAVDKAVPEPETGFKVVAWSSGVIALLVTAAIVVALVILAPVIKPYTEKLSFEPGAAKSILKIDGVAKGSTEEAGFGKAKWSWYYDSGRTFGEIVINLYTGLESFNLFYENGKIKAEIKESENIFSKGKIVYYDKNGNVESEKELR